MNTFEREQTRMESNTLSRTTKNSDLSADQIQGLIADARRQRNLRLVQLLSRITRSCTAALGLSAVEPGDKPAVARPRHARPSPGFSDVETPAVPPVQAS